MHNIDLLNPVFSNICDGISQEITVIPLYFSSFSLIDLLRLKKGLPFNHHHHQFSLATCINYDLKKKSMKKKINQDIGN